MPTVKALDDFHPAHAESAWTSVAEVDRLDVVILGAGIAGTQLASRLANAGANVALVVGKASPPRRLVDGCSLRRATLHHMADAVGQTLPAFETSLRVEQSGFRGLHLTSSRDANRATPTLDTKRKFSAIDTNTIGLSARHGDILCALRARLPHSVHLVDGLAQAYRPGEHVLEMTCSEGKTNAEWPLSPRAIVVNTSTTLLGAPSTDASTPRHFVIAVQQPITGERNTLDDHAWAPSFLDGAQPHLGFVTPFWDSRTDAATHYAINTTIVDAATFAARGKDALIASVQRGLDQCVAALGMHALEADETTGSACIPVTHDFRAVWTGGLVDAYAALSPGVPAINVDGMLAQSTGIATLARMLDRARLGEVAHWRSAFAAVERALRPIRRWNRFTAWNYFRASWGMREMNRRATRLLGRRVVRTWADLGK